MSGQADRYREDEPGSGVGSTEEQVPILTAVQPASGNLADRQEEPGQLAA